ncbi:MAG TPA: hypothetical protein VGL07_14270 [Buttiauxella sp.]|jgi:hypothetical protein
MKIYKVFFIPALLLNGIFNTYAGDIENNMTDDYVSTWNEAMNGSVSPILQAVVLGSDIVKSCKTVAPKQFRSKIIQQWGLQTGMKITQTAFLSENLQLFDRLAEISCLEGAGYEYKGNGDQLIKELNALLVDMDVKDGHDAYAQIKTMEFQTGIMTTRYGIRMVKDGLHRAN